MTQYKDTEGDEWTLSIHMAAVMEVKDELDVNLCDAVDFKFLQKLHGDPICTIRILATLLKDQIAERGLDAREFAKRHGRDVMFDATIALRTEIVNFSPSPKARAAMHQLIETTEQADEKLRTMALEQMEAADANSLAKSAFDFYLNSQQSEDAENAPA